MSKDWINSLSSKIEAELKRCNKPPPSVVRPIYKVPPPIRELDAKAYEPRIVSLGPYHHGKEALQGMEANKRGVLNYTTHCLNTEIKVEDYISVIKGMEKDARDFYSDLREVNDMGSNEFVKMLLFDACFLLFLLLMSSPSLEESKATVTKEVPSHNATRGKPSWEDGYISHDIFLLENQIPFAIVEKIYELAVPNHSNTPLKDLARKLVKLHLKQYTNADPDIGAESEHLLDFCYRSICSNVRPDNGPPPPRNDTSVGKPIKVRNAVELWKSGIKLKKSSRKRLLDITFNNGTIEIPLLTLEDSTNSLFRNLIAYEQSIGRQHFSSYVLFISNLIDTASDVELLIRKEILQNHLSSNQEACDVLSKLATEIYMLPIPTHLKTLFDDVEKFSCSKLRRWEAWIRHKYNNPWLILKLTAATILLVCSILQVIYAVKSSWSPPPTA